MVRHCGKRTFSTLCVDTAQKKKWNKAKDKICESEDSITHSEKNVRCTFGSIMYWCHHKPLKSPNPRRRYVI